MMSDDNIVWDDPNSILHDEPNGEEALNSILHDEPNGEEATSDNQMSDDIDIVWSEDDLNFVSSKAFFSIRNLKQIKAGFGPKLDELDFDLDLKATSKKVPRSEVGKKSVRVPVLESIAFNVGEKAALDIEARSKVAGAGKEASEKFQNYMDAVAALMIQVAQGNQSTDSFDENIATQIAERYMSEFILLNSPRIVDSSDAPPRQIQAERIKRERQRAIHFYETRWDDDESSKNMIVNTLTKNCPDEVHEKCRRFKEVFSTDVEGVKCDSCLNAYLLSMGARMPSDADDALRQVIAQFSSAADRNQFLDDLDDEKAAKILEDIYVDGKLIANEFRQFWGFEVVVAIFDPSLAKEIGEKEDTICLDIYDDRKTWAELETLGSPLMNSQSVSRKVSRKRPGGEEVETLTKSVKLQTSPAVNPSGNEKYKKIKTFRQSHGQPQNAPFKGLIRIQKMLEHTLQKRDLVAHNGGRIGMIAEVYRGGKVKIIALSGSDSNIPEYSNNVPPSDVLKLDPQEIDLGDSYDRLVTAYENYIEQNAKEKNNVVKCMEAYFKAAENTKDGAK